jgi:hypothetical protein
MSFVWSQREQMQFFLNNIKQLIIVTEMRCVFLAIGGTFLNAMWVI